MTGNAIRIIKEDFLTFFKQCFFGGRGGVSGHMG